MKKIIKIFLFSVFTFITANLYAATNTAATNNNLTTTVTTAPQALTSLTFGVAIEQATLYSTQTIAAAKASYQRFVTNLSQQLKTPIKLVVFNDPLNLVTAVTTGQVDLAYMSPMTFVKALIINQHIKPLATTLSLNQATNIKTPVTNSYLVTLASNTKIKKLSDLYNAKLGFAKDSASGYYLPADDLQQERIAYSVQFYNNQNDALQALKQGKIDAAELWDPTFALANSKLQLKTIVSITNVPNPVIVATTAVPAAQRIEIRKTILGLSNDAYEGTSFVGVTAFFPEWYHNSFVAVKTVIGPSA